MTIAQVRASRRRHNLQRRENGPWPQDKTKAAQRLQQRIADERERISRKKGK